MGQLQPVTIIICILILPALLFLRKDILSHPESGLPIIAFLIPFERLGAIHAFIDIRLSQIAVIILFLIYIVNIVRYKLTTGHIEKGLVKKDFSFLLLLIFASVCIISIYHPIYFLRSFEVLVFDLFIFFVYLFIANIIKNTDILRRIVLALLLTSLLTGLFGLFQFFAGMLNVHASITGLAPEYDKFYSTEFFNNVRIQATGLEPEYWGSFLLIPLGLSISLILTYVYFLPPFRKRNTGTKKIVEQKIILEVLEEATSTQMIDKNMFFLSIAVLVIVIANIVLTFSRGAWYASLAVIGILLFLSFAKLRNIRVLMAVVVIGMYSAGLFFSLKYVLLIGNAATVTTTSPSEIITTVTPTSIGNKTAATKTPTPTAVVVTPTQTIKTVVNRAINDRILLFSDPGRSSTKTQALQIFKEHMLLGIGVGGFGPYEAPKTNVSLKNYVHWAIVNNEYLEILAETGILGFISFAAFILFILTRSTYALLKKYATLTPLLQATLIALIATLCGMLLQYVAFSTLWIFQIWFVISLLGALSYTILHGTDHV